MTNPAMIQTGGASGGAALSEEVAPHVASLSRLLLDEATLMLYREQLGRVLEYVEAIRAVDVSATAPMLGPGETDAVLREDTPGECLEREALMKMAPEVDAPFLRVPKVLGGSSGA